MVKHITKAKWYGIFKTYEANAIEWNYDAKIFNYNSLLEYNKFVMK